jgi:hypothetical protein
MTAADELAQAQRDYETTQQTPTPTPVREETEDPS